MATATYKLKDSNGRELASITSVLAPVALTGVSVSSTSNLVTVDSTTGCYPGMPVAIPNIPQGAFIHAVRSATEIDLWATAWDATTGIWTTSAANANATVATSGILGAALGFDPRCIVSLTYARGVWRNLHSDTSALLYYSVGTVSSLGAPTGKGVSIVPTTLTPTPEGLTRMTASEARVSDHLAATPLKRHNGEPWGVYILVSTGGHQSVVQAIPEKEILYTGPSA